MHFPFGVWQLVTSFLVHNIQTHGKHLKANAENQQYNRVMCAIPRPTISTAGPKIVFTSAQRSPRFVKFLYHSTFLTTQYHRSIVEYQVWKDGKKYLDEYLCQF